ncbi:RNA polymerase sigma factor [Maribellus maritimus]|uniref:RNA polymerase sigma factor n=1 Tax=Maribellus maritimus TaxID=2870838 RepID=UPI001EEACACE|nr:sigma-70 family RNA polymerase sigma factor [Maribellus maritimus]MCG6191030.1 sigma-70 family RNA polymerase sigma factor [Maribellus maritimus]
MKADNYQLIENCKSGDVQAREWLYKRYAPVLLGVCVRYLGGRAQGEDILHESFITIFSKIAQLKENAALEGWMRKVVVNTALKHLRKENITYNIDEVRETSFDSFERNNSSDIKERVLKSNVSQDDILKIIRELPLGYRTIFNLYAIENFRHKEIAKELGISEGTSRSQLLRARSLIQKKIYELVEKDGKSKNKEKVYFTSILLVLNEKLEYIDTLVVDKLKDYNVTPGHPLKIPLSGSDKIIGKISGKLMFFAGKKMLWIFSYVIGITGISLLIFFCQSQNTETLPLPDFSEQSDFSQYPVSTDQTSTTPGDISAETNEISSYESTNISNVDNTQKENDKTVIQSKKVWVRKKVIKKKQVILESQTAKNDSI